MLNLPPVEGKTATTWLWLSLLIVIVDQITKQLANTYLTYQEPLAMLPLFNLTLVYNTGAAFSLFADAGGWQRYFLTGLSFIVSIGLVVILSRLSAQKMLLATALAMILGGAVGNLIDRALFGYVIDFLDFYYSRWHYPAFNVADSAITVGAGLLVVDLLFGKEKGEVK